MQAKQIEICLRNELPDIRISLTNKNVSSKQLDLNSDNTHNFAKHTRQFHNFHFTNCWQIAKQQIAAIICFNNAKLEAENFNFKRWIAMVVQWSHKETTNDFQYKSKDY